MALGYIVRETFNDTRKIGDFNDNPLLKGKGAAFNTNFYAVVDIVDDANPLAVIDTFTTWSNDLTDAYIDNLARGRIAAILQRNSAKAAITVGQLKIPAPVDPTVLDAQQKAQAFQIALGNLSVLKQQQALGVDVADAEITSAIGACNTAKAALSKL